MTLSMILNYEVRRGGPVNSTSDPRRDWRGTDENTSAVRGCGSGASDRDERRCRDRHEQRGGRGQYSVRMPMAPSCTSIRPKLAMSARQASWPLGAFLGALTGGRGRSRRRSRGVDRRHLHRLPGRTRLLPRGEDDVVEPQVVAGEVLLLVALQVGPEPETASTYGTCPT